MRTTMVGLMLGAVAGAAGAAPPPGPSPTAAYARALAPVADCAAFARSYSTLPDARPLIRHLFDLGILTKRAAESDDAFMNRAVKQLFAALGDPSRLHLSVAAGGFGRYDAARGTMVLRLPHPFEAPLDRWGRQEVRLNGGASLVTETELRAAMAFDSAALPAVLTLSMSAADAAAFADQGRLETLSVFEDYGTDASHDTATAGTAAIQTSYRLVRLRPKCALVTVGGKAVAGWTYDRWEEPGE